MAASATWLITHPGLWWTSEPHRCLLAVAWSCEPSLLVLPVSLSISQPASQPASLSVTESATQLPLSPWPEVLPSFILCSHNYFTWGASGSALHAAPVFLSGSHADCRPSLLVPPLHGLPFHRGSPDSHPGQSEKMSQPCRRDKMQWGKARNQ